MCVMRGIAKSNTLAIFVSVFYDRLEIKPCGLGSRIQDVEAF